MNEIDQGIAKIKRRIANLEELDIQAAVLQETCEDDVVTSDVRETIREVFGYNSPEFKEHEHLRIWVGSEFVNMPDTAIINAKEKGKVATITILKGLICRLEEKRLDFVNEGSIRAPRGYLKDLNLHPRIAEVAIDLFMDGHTWPAVFAASKTLINYVKEKSMRYDLDGAPLMRTVFSKKNPILMFNDLLDQTDSDEQEGMMHLFEGAVLGIRNPGGHSFPEGSDQRAIEYLEFLSLLAFRVEEARLKDQ